MKKLFYGVLFLVFILQFSIDIYAQNRVVLGLENLLQEQIDLIQGQRIGLMANHTSVDAQGTPILELLEPHCDVTVVFALEHGFTGNVEAGKKIEDEEVDDFTIYSLYGKTRKPTEEMLEDVDVIIYDVQDVGAKFYTYISSLYHAMQAAKEHDRPIIVLDRPNPIRADIVQGPVTEPDFFSFVGIAPLPIRYGMTVGEIAQWFNGEELRGEVIDADLTVIELTNYERDLDYDKTGLPWVPPSPNMPDLETAYIYPGTCLFEGTNVSEGRGTEKPFLIIGAPFIDAVEWLKEIPNEVTNGLEIQPTRFVPLSLPGKVSNPKYEDEECQGVEITILDDSEITPIPLAVAMLTALRDLYPDDFETKSFMNLLWGSDRLRNMLDNGASFEYIIESYEDDLEEFEDSRKKYLIY